MAFSSLVINSALAILCAFFIAAIFHGVIEKIELYEHRLGADLQIESLWQRFKIQYRIYFYFGINFLIVALMFSLQGLKVTPLGLYIGLFTILTISISREDALSKTKRPLCSISSLFRSGVVISVIGCAEVVVSKGLTYTLSSELFQNGGATIGEMVLVITLLPLPFLALLEVIGYINKH